MTTAAQAADLALAGGTLLLLAQTLRIAVPLALAAAGGAVSERSGVVNIALEGMLLAGAFGYTLGADAAARALGIEGVETSLPTHLAIAGAGVLAAVVAGLLLAAVHAVAVLVFRADHVVSGVALNLLAAGTTKFLLKVVFGSSSNSSWVFGLPDLGPLARVPVVGRALGSPMVWLTAAVVIGAQLLLFRTVWGLRARAAGEHPAAAEAAGLSVPRLRAGAVLLSGLFAALGGAWLAADQHQFTEGMSAGRGYIALAAVIFGRWHPSRAAAACLLFAASEAVQIRLQGTALAIPGPLLQTLPYVLAILILAGGAGKAAVPPGGLGKPYPAEPSR